MGIGGDVLVVEDAAGAAGFVSVRQEEVTVAPFLVFWVVGGVVAVAGGFEGGVEAGGVGL